MEILRPGSSVLVGRSKDVRNTRDNGPAHPGPQPLPADACRNLGDISCIVSRSESATPSMLDGRCRAVGRKERTPRIPWIQDLADVGQGTRLLVLAKGSADPGAVSPPRPRQATAPKPASLPNPDMKCSHAKVLTILMERVCLESPSPMF